MFLQAASVLTSVALGIIKEQLYRDDTTRGKDKIDVVGNLNRNRKISAVLF
jgi:hypothetical protein